MNEQLRFSIVVPSFNAVATIGRALASLRAQKYQGLEVICVDGASVDGTVAEIRRFGDLVATVVSEPDEGPADALNKGFRLAKGAVLGWLNADDELAEGALAHVAALFERHPEVDVITGGCRRFFPDGSQLVTHIPIDYLEVLALRNGIEQPSTFWRSDVHRKAGVIDTSYSLAFDWEWWNRLKRAGARFMTTDRVLSHYHFSEENLTSRGGRRLVDEMYRVTKAYAHWGGAPADIYQFLYEKFDLRGFFDVPSGRPRWQVVLFRGLLFALGWVGGGRTLRAYNWNFASKQERGLVWYRHGVQVGESLEAQGAVDRAVPSSTAGCQARRSTIRAGEMGMEAALRGLWERGFCPRVIADVGAAAGAWTRLARKYWPEAEVFCLEALEERRAELEALVKKSNGKVKVIMGGVGEEEGRLTFGVSESLWDSSFAYAGQKVRDVDVHSLDGLLALGLLREPQFLKLDVQGFERRILRGGRKCLEGCEVILMECQFFSFCEDMTTLDHTLAFMADLGYVPYEFVEFLRRPLDGAMGQCDLLFVRKGHPLVSDLRWAAT